MVGGIVFFVNLWLCFVKNMKCLHRYHKIVKEIYKSAAPQKVDTERWKTDGK